jgi:hypothetical protein
MQCPYSCRREKTMMIDDKLRIELLDAANQSILDEARKHIIIASSSNNIAGVTSGSLRLYPSLIKKFDLIIAKPKSLLAFEWNEIRCCLCRKAISYPCWYYSIRYAVNHFHYFICFQPADDNTKPNTKCYRR